MSGQHSIIPPSSATRRAQCRASAVAELMLPDKGLHDEDAKTGEAVHEIGETMIDSFCRGGVNFPSRDIIGTLATNGTIIDDDMYDGALMYAEDVREIMVSSSVFGGDNLRIEQRVHSPRIHPESWGTPDFSLFDSRTYTLYMHDLKYGHKVVEAFENYQMVEYASGLIDEITNGNGLHDQHLTVVFTVVQPCAPHRDGPIRRWKVKASDLRSLFNYLSSVEHECLDPDPSYTVGPECKDCKANHGCTVLQSGSMEAVAFSGKSPVVNPDSQSLSIEIKLLRHAKKVIESRLNGLEPMAEAMIQQGQGVPGFIIEHGNGRETWTVDKQEIFSIGDMMGVDLRKEVEPITPKQALKRGLDEQTVKHFTKQNKTKAKLVESDKTLASLVFKKR